MSDTVITIHGGGTLIVIAAAFILGLLIGKLISDSKGK